jgi:WD40 repeat protein
VQLQVWEIETGAVLFEKTMQTKSLVGLLHFTRDGKKLLVSLRGFPKGEGLFCWDIATGQLVWQNKDFTQSGSDAVLTLDNKLITNSVNMPCLDVVTGQPVATHNLPKFEFGDRLAATPDGRYLLMSSRKGVRVWDLFEGKTKKTLANVGTVAAIAPDGKSIVTNNGMLQRWDLATGKPLWPDNSDQGHLGQVHIVRFFARGQKLASGGADGTIRVWDVAGARPLKVWRRHEPGRRLFGIQSGLVNFDITPDGRRILSVGEDRPLSLRAWDADLQKELSSFSPSNSPEFGPTQSIYYLRIDRDGRRGHALIGPRSFGTATTANKSGTLATWDLNTGELISSIATPPHHWNDVSVNGQVGIADGTLIDLRSGKKVATIEGFRSTSFLPSPFAFSAGGVLIAGLHDTSMSFGVWETFTGKKLVSLDAPAMTTDVAFLPDSRHVAIRCNGMVRICEILSGQKVADIEIPRGTLFNRFGRDRPSLAFSPDSKLMAIGQNNGTILLWEVELPARPAMRLSAKETASLWEDLVSEDAVRAWRAAGRLADAPADALPLLRNNLKPDVPAPDDVTRPLLVDLDSGSFPRREKAQKALQKLGHQAGPALRRALKAPSSEEARRRIDNLLRKLNEPMPLFPETLRALRAVTILEWIGTPEARSVLQTLANGLPTAPLAQQARAALDHLSARE